MTQEINWWGKGVRVSGFSEGTCEKCHSPLFEKGAGKNLKVCHKCK